MLDARGQLSRNQRAWAERFAQWGFLALTLDSFSPRGAGSICPIPGAQRPAKPWEDRTADAYAALAWLVRRADVDPQRIFVAGWSHGGVARCCTPCSVPRYGAACAATDWLSASTHAKAPMIARFIAPLPPLGPPFT